MSDVHRIILVFEHSGLVVVYIEIIRSGKYGDERGETSTLGFPIHAKTRGDQCVNNDIKS